MGLIFAGINSARGTFADQWKECFVCDAMDASVLLTRGIKQNEKGSQNTKGNDNVITDGSKIIVGEGQCMMIVEQGKIVEVCAQAGEYTYDNKVAPTLFTGKLGDSIKETFEVIGKRFTFGSNSGMDQRVYYINTKEIVGNKYGTANPVPFRVVDNNIGLDIDISIKCHGEYSYQITDPLLFYTNVAGNVVDRYTRDSIDSVLKTELLTALQPAFANISEMGVRYSALPGHTSQLADLLNQVLTEKWAKQRGIKIITFGVNSVVASKEDEDMIKELQKTAVLRNSGMAAATLTQAQADAMRSAAANESTGPMMAFAGMNMATQAGGINANQLYQQQAEQAQQMQAAPAMVAPTSVQGAWSCVCGHDNTGKFCGDCGLAQPVPSSNWTCGCGHNNTGKFCGECGSPNKAVKIVCDKCGFTPEEGAGLKFCPECGDVINELDRK